MVVLVVAVVVMMLCFRSAVVFNDCWCIQIVIALDLHDFWMAVLISDMFVSMFEF